MKNYNYRNLQMAKYAVAEMNDLVTSPPKKQADNIACIKESVDDMNCVEITITFKPTLINTSDIALRSIVHDSINACFERGTCILYHEYGNNGRLHYHGILSSVSKKDLSTIRKQFEIHIGRTEIRTITYYESYLRYMTKEVMELDYDDSLNIIIYK